MVKALQEFLGMANFYHCFMPEAAAIMRPLYSATSEKSKSVIWTPNMVSAFKWAKAAFIQAMILAHPRNDAPVAITVDASDHAVAEFLNS